jgi:shikimate kinase
LDRIVLSGNIVLTGASGSGKSTIGRQLAKLVGFGFLDLDELIEKKNGKRISELFKSSGEDFFREEESRMLNELQSIKSHVISVGGGALLTESGFELARKLGSIVWVQSSPVEIARRLFKKADEIEKRPLLKDFVKIENNQERLKAIQAQVKSLMDERRPWYSRADVVLDGSYVTSEMAAHHLKDILETEGLISRRSKFSANWKGNG